MIQAKYSHNSPLAENVFAVVREIPRGKVLTYKDVAKAVGTHPRVIGRVLHMNEDPKTYPCHRVIKSDGSVASGYAFGGSGKQLAILEREGVVFVSGRVDLSQFRWQNNGAK